MPAALDDDAVKARWEAIEAHNGNISAAARFLGMRPNGLKEWVRNNRDPAIQAAMNAVGTQMQPGLVWVKTKGKDGEPGHSVLLKPTDTAPDLLERLATAFADIPAREPVKPPEAASDALLTMYPLFDAHIGMMAWGRETGSEDYDLSLAASDLHMALAKVMAITPNSGEAIFLIGGDCLHADDNRAETPASRHKLDVDGRQFKVTVAAVEMLANAIEAILAKHGRVQVRVMRGNHDEHAHLILTHALAQRYRLEPRISVEMEPRDLFMRQWGASAIFAHHGDKAKPQQIALYLSDVCPFWSATKHRHYFSGHVHHDQAKDIGPLRWETLRPFCPPDAYAASMGYGARRALQSVTFHREDGLVQRNYDPIQRTA